MSKVSVITRNRTVLLDDSLTIRQAQYEVKKRGLKLSLRLTFQYYGLKYVEDRSFISRYRQEFNLSDKKSMYDIKLHELVLYRDLLIGHEVVGKQLSRFR